MPPVPLALAETERLIDEADAEAEAVVFLELSLYSQSNQLMLIVCVDITSGFEDVTVNPAVVFTPTDTVQVTLLRSRSPDCGVELTPVRKIAEPVRPSVGCCASSGIVRVWLEHFVEHDSTTRLTDGLPFALTRPIITRAVVAMDSELNILAGEIFPTI